MSDFYQTLAEADDEVVAATADRLEMRARLVVRRRVDADEGDASARQARRGFWGPIRHRHLHEHGARGLDATRRDDERFDQRHAEGGELDPRDVHPRSMDAQPTPSE